MLYAGKSNPFTQHLVAVSLIVLALASPAASATASTQRQRTPMPLPPVQPGLQTPHLKRDRTQRLLYTRILQHEDERVVDRELIDMLSAPHYGIRRRAILALGRIAYPSGIAPLVEVLAGNNSSEMRALAAFSLGQIQSQYAVTALLERLDATGETPEVKARAAEALGKIASNTLSAAVLGDYGLETVVSKLIHLLPEDGRASAEQKPVVSAAIAALLRIKNPSSSAAIAHLLKSPDEDLKWQAANALARIKTGFSPAVTDLIGLLADKEPLVRGYSARALGALKDPAAIESLIKLLEDPDARVQSEAINALGKYTDPKAVDSLIALGQKVLAQYKGADRSAGVVPPQQNQLLLIVTALGTMKDARALPFLKSVRFVDGKIGFSPESEIAVAKFGLEAYSDVPPGIAQPRDWQAVSAYAEGLGQIKSAKSRDTLTDILSGDSSGKPDPRSVPPVLRSLDAIHVDGLQDILLFQLKAEDVFVRATSAELLAEMRSSPDVVAALEQAYKAAAADKINDARLAIVEAADKLGHPLNTQVLSDTTPETDYVVRRRAAELLRNSTTVQSPQSKPTVLSQGKPAVIPGQSGPSTGTQKLQVGKAKTGHDHEYYRQVLELMHAPSHPIAVIHTRKGDIKIELFNSDAPMAVENFVRLSKSGFYNGLTFMRVVPDFVIQGGDPRNDMNGGPGYQIRDEINLKPYLTGTLGMALSGKDTGGSQFFITQSPQPHLDGGYTAFGQVVSGIDVVNRMAKGDSILGIEIVDQ